jgi:hypothetical protein
MMNQTIGKYAGFTLGLLLLFGSPALTSGQNTGLDEALQGFGDDAADTGKDTSLEDALEGFDDRAADPKVEEEARRSKPSVADLTGSVALSSVSNLHQHKAIGTNTDYSGLSRLRTTLDLTLDARISRAWDAKIRGWGFYDAAYRLNGRDHYTEQVISSMESEAELRDTFIRGKLLPSLDIKVGRQIVVWGKSDNLRVTDVLNPLDNREPGIVDIEDLRLPLAMSRVDWYAGKWNVTGIAIPEIRFNKNPAFGSDFYPSATPPVPENIPSDGGSNTEFAFAVNGILTGWDISFYLARIFDDRPSLRIVPETELVHNRLTMAGTAINVARGNWLVKSEGAYFSGLEFSALPERTLARSDVLVGLEYSGLRETMVSLEVVNRHLHSYDEALAGFPDHAKQDEVQTALRYQQDFLNQRLHLTLLALTQGWNGRDGKVQRLSLEYELTDNIGVLGGFVNYGAGRRPEFRNIGKNDRVFLEAKYSF